jgi:hypothetical protein
MPLTIPNLACMEKHYEESNWNTKSHHPME